MAITWDNVGERRYETGIDHGVLYPFSGTPVPWNGLVSVAESQSQSVTPQYIDGIKFHEEHRSGDYRVKVKAITYPDVLDRLTGLSERVSGVLLGEQQASTFHLSYRTLVGDDVNGVSHYKLHIVYNCLAIPSDHSYDTVGSSSSVPTFDWDLSSLPIAIFGIRPVSHVVFDSRRINPGSLAAIEASMYDGVHSDPLWALGGAEAYFASIVAA